MSVSLKTKGEERFQGKSDEPGGKIWREITVDDGRKVRDILGKVVESPTHPWGFTPLRLNLKQV